MKHYQSKSAALELTSADDETRVVKGYGSIFGNLDSDSDTIQKGAFKKTIKERGPEGKNRIKLVSQHDISVPVAKITTLKEDEKGLYFEAKFGTHQAGEDHYRMVKEGILTEFSVGFINLNSKDNKAGGQDIEEIKLYEISLVTVAANDEARVSEVKADDYAKEIVDIVATADKEKAEEVEVLLLKMANHFNINTTQAAEALEPVVEKSAEELFLTELKNSL